MQDKIDAFLTALKGLLEKKGEKPALQRDLENPEKFAEHISHSIGSETQKINLGIPPKK